MQYKEVDLHGFESRETGNTGTDYENDIPEGFGTQLNILRRDGKIFVIPFRNMSDGIPQPIGDKGYIIEGDVENYDIVKWYRSEIVGIEAAPWEQPAPAEGIENAPVTDTLQ